MSASGRPGAFARALLLAATGLGLCWAIIAYSGVAYLAADAPASAAAIRTEPLALFNLAERRLEELTLQARSLSRITAGMSAKPDAAQADAGDRLRAWAGLAPKTIVAEAGTSASLEDGERLRAMLRAALLRDPLNARGFRLLGQVEERRGGAREDVARYMRIAAARSSHETAAVWWLMRAGLDSGDSRSTIAFADTILRTQSRLTVPAVEVLSKVAQTPEGMAELTKVLLANPPWRGSFFRIWPQHLADARAPLVPLLALRDSPRPPTSAELGAYMNVLMQHKIFDLAYYTWLQFLPPQHLEAVTGVFNGSFELVPSGLPFDWIIPKSTGVTAGIVARPGTPGARALLIEFGLGRIDFPGVTQTLLLPAGSYRFAAAYRGQVSGRRGLVWQVTCLGEPRTSLGASAMILGTTPAWSRIAFDFKVPDAGCPAQLLRLYHDARTPSEQLVNGWSFHDDVTLTRLDAP